MGDALVPAPVQAPGRCPELDNQIAGEVLRLDFAPLFPPQPKEGGFVIAHDNPGIGTPNKIASSFGLTMDSTHN
jgi:hypothetical protein